MAHLFDRSNLQSIVFQSHPCAYSRHFLFRFGDKAGARQFLAEWTPCVTHGGVAIDPENLKSPIINIALSWPGLDRCGAFDALGGRNAAAQVFSADFKDPSDAVSLRAYGPSGPENWWNGHFKTEDVDVSVHVYCATADKLASASEKLRASAKRHGLEELLPTRGRDAITGQVLGAGIPGLRRLHFGYNDGFSQPQVNWDEPTSPQAPSAISRTVYPRGHFIIDEWDDHAPSFPRPEPWRTLVRHGSYMAFAWIYQDVARFNRFLRKNAARIARPEMSQADAEEFLAAKLMGRWRDGTPLVLAPDRPDADRAPEDFDYSEDVQGLRCPVAAHIRIVNGRDRPLNFANRVMFPGGFPRVLRRGSSYGTWLQGEVDDGQDRGIAGIFICANINRQFYPLTRWIGTTNFSDDYKDMPTGQDPLFGNREVPNASTRFTVPTENGQVFLDGLQNFVRIQGVLILLLPSLATLRTISGC